MSVLKKKAVCCCGALCCQCDRAAEVCCYHPDDVLTLVISRTHMPLRTCGERCGSSNELTCQDCVDYADSNQYTLSVCDGALLEWVRVGADTCFPKWIRRTCAEDEWKFYSDANDLIPVESLPLCQLCTLDCEFDPLLCVEVDPCDLTLTCCSGGEASVASPPSPYTSCTHDDGANVGGVGFCFCAGAGCYTYDYKAWLPMCVFDETGGAGSCIGDGTESQACVEVEVSFTIEQHCEPNGLGGCRRISA